MYARGRGGGGRAPLSTGLNCIHNHLSILYNNLSTESQSQWKRKYAGACFCFSFLFRKSKCICRYKHIQSPMLRSQILPYHKQRQRPQNPRGQFPLASQSPWNIARLKASSDKRARGNFLEDRWAWRAWGTCRAKTLEVWRGRTQGAACRDKIRWASFPSNSQEEQRGMVQKSRRGRRNPGEYHIFCCFKHTSASDTYPSQGQWLSIKTNLHKVFEWYKKDPCSHLTPIK